MRAWEFWRRQGPTVAGPAYLCRTNWRSWDCTQKQTARGTRNESNRKNTEFSLSVSFCGRGAGKHELGLICCGDFQVEIVEVGIFFRIEQTKTAGKDTHHVNLTFIRGGLNSQQSMIGPGDVLGLRHTLDGVTGREVKGDFVLLHSGVVKINRREALILRDEGVAGAG